MEGLKNLLKKTVIKLYEISISKTAYSFIMFAILFVSTRCVLSAWHDEGIVDELQEIEKIIN